MILVLRSGQLIYGVIEVDDPLDIEPAVRTWLNSEFRSLSGIDFGEHDGHQAVSFTGSMTGGYPYLHTICIQPFTPFKIG